MASLAYPYLVLIIATALSSFVSLSSTLVVILLQHMNHHGLDGGSGVSGGGEHFASSGPSERRVKASALTASSDISHAHKAQPLDCLATVDASLDLLSQLLFLGIVLTALMKLNNSNNGISLLDDRFTLFTCALVLSLRLVIPLVKTVLAATPSTKIKERSTRTVYALFVPPALIVSFLVATAALGAGMLHSESSVGIVLLCAVGVCLSAHTFVAMRLVLIKRRSEARRHLRSRRHTGQAKDGPASAGQLKTPAFLASTMSTAGTKASSANPYETALRRSVIAPFYQDSKCEGLSSTSLIIAGYVPPDEEAVRESSESDLSLHRSQNPCTVWSNQTLPFPREGNDLGPANSILHPASLSLENQEVSYASHRDNADRIGARLRVYSSARDLMTPFSLDTLEVAANDLALQPILLALITVWLTSLLCLPLLVTTTVPAYQTSRSQLPFTLCFILAMSISGPILLFHVLRMRRAKAGELDPSTGVISLDEVFPRPSFASSLLTGRTSNVSSALSTSEGMPIAGNGFEPVNGYDTPVLFCQDGSYQKPMVKSVAYPREHWSAGRIDGDQIASSQGIFRRATNMLSPKPKLQVLSPQVVKQRGRVRHMPGHMSVEDRFDEGDDDEYDRSSSQAGFLQDISETSVVLPEALPDSAIAGLIQESSLNMQGSRRIETIYEADTPCASESGLSLRKRRAASVISISTVETNGSCTDPGQSRRDGAALAASSFTSAAHHRGSFSMSVISEAKDRWPSCMSERRLSPDATVSDVELADISNLSCQTRQGYENDSTGKISPVKNAGDVQLQNVEQDSSTRNWLRLEDSSPQGSESAADGDISVSSTTRSLAGGMGIYLLDQDEPVASVLVTQSTPPGRSSHDSLSAAQETTQKRKSLSCEMGLPSKTACDSPSHSLSDISSVQAKRSTLDTITESLLSGGSAYDEEEGQSPNGTLERARRTQAAIEREIVVIEMDESQSSPQQIGGCEVGTQSPLASQFDAQAEAGVKEEFTFTTHHFYQQQGNWLDPVEEVTEEPTLPMSGRDTPTQSAWSYTSSTNSSSKSSMHRRNRSLVRSKMPSDEWVRLHGFATPSSLAQSPASQSRFGWAEVIETGRVAARVSLQRQYSRSPRSRSSSRSYHGRGGNGSIGMMDVNLSPHARAYLATRCGTPSRLIGLQSSFWLTSPPRLALHARTFKEEGRSEKLKSRKAIAPSLDTPLLDHDESSWVDGALDDKDEEEAKQQMQRAEKKWKRKSRRMQGLVEGVTVTPPLVSAVSMTSPQAKSRIKATSRSSKRSSASLQSIFDAAMRRGSGILLPPSRKRESNSSGGSGGSGSGSQSVRNSVASVATVKSASVRGQEGLGGSGAFHSRSLTRASPPSTPRKQCSPTTNASLDRTVAGTESSMASKPKVKGREDGEEIETVVANGHMPQTPPSHGSTRELHPSAARRSTRSMRSVKSGYADSSSYGSPLKPASRKAIIAEHRVPSRKDTKVRETVKMLENAVRAAMEQQEQYASLHEFPHDEILASPLRVTTSPLRPRKRKVMHPREVVRGSPGKFRLIQDLDLECVKESLSPQEEEIHPTKARSYTRAGPAFLSRRRSSAACPQIIVRPPSGSSTHTHRLQ